MHSGVKDLAAYTRQGDIVIAGVGIPNFVTADMVRPGAVVISGGISWSGRKLLADVADDVAEVASWVTRWGRPDHGGHAAAQHRHRRRTHRCRRLTSVADVGR